jgi:hypothetical protein
VAGTPRGRHRGRWRPRSDRGVRGSRSSPSDLQGQEVGRASCSTDARFPRTRSGGRGRAAITPSGCPRPPGAPPVWAGPRTEVDRLEWREGDPGDPAALLADFLAAHGLAGAPSTQVGDTAVSLLLGAVGCARVGGLPTGRATPVPAVPELAAVAHRLGGSPRPRRPPPAPSVRGRRRGPTPSTPRPSSTSGRRSAGATSTRPTSSGTAAHRTAPRRQRSPPPSPGSRVRCTAAS